MKSGFPLDSRKISRDMNMTISLLSLINSMNIRYLTPIVIVVIVKLIKNIV